jgi:hypothetical protein|tara:strand:- start:318 stop:713 length:396 start_codon:yes stop_codon:yes gene_type:complete
MDSKLIEGVVGGVLNRHKLNTLDENKIAVLSVEIAAVLNDTMDKLKVSKSIKYEYLSKNKPLDMTMWKGAKDLKVGDTIKQDDWKCKYCNGSMWQVAWDYVGMHGNHLSCELEQEISDEEQSDKLKKKESK